MRGMLAAGCLLAVAACKPAPESTPVEAGAPAEAAAAKPAGPLYVVDHYDPAADPEADLARAVERATAENKRILLFTGGEWCVWCHYLEDVLDANASAHDAFAASFVVMKVNYSPENKNETFLSKYPPAEGYPDFQILESDGTFLAHQGTEPLEEGRSYNQDRLVAFAEQWRKS